MLQVSLVSSTRDSATEPKNDVFLWWSLFSKESPSDKVHVCLLLWWEQSLKRHCLSECSCVKILLCFLAKKCVGSSAVFLLATSETWLWAFLRLMEHGSHLPQSVALCIHCQTASWSCLRHCYPPLLKWRQSCASQASCEIQQTPSCFQEIFSFFFLFFNSFLST